LRVPGCPAAVLRARSGGGLHLISEDEAGLERLRADVAAGLLVSRIDRREIKDVHALRMCSCC